MEHEGSLPCSKKLVPILSQMNPIHTFPISLLKLYSNIIFRSTLTSFEWSPSFRFFDQNVRISDLSYTCYMPHQSHPLRFELPNNIWWSIQIMKLLILQFSPAHHLRIDSVTHGTDYFIICIICSSGMWDLFIINYLFLKFPQILLSFTLSLRMADIKSSAR